VTIVAALAFTASLLADYVGDLFAEAIVGLH
jgi:hypothetical protein